MSADDARFGAAPASDGARRDGAEPEPCAGRLASAPDPKTAASGSGSVSYDDAREPGAPAPAAPRVVEVTCIRCPVGCVVSVEVAADGAAVYRAGATCARGREYAVSEATAPVRSVATTVVVPGCGEPLSVRTAAPVPKALVGAAVRAMKAARVELPVRAGDVVLADVCATGVAAVATKSLP